MYAYAAYNISENYLKPNDISSDSIAIADLGEWGMARQYMGDLICHRMIDGYDFTLFDIGDLIEGTSALIDAAEENLTFSDEQLKLGEAVAQELEEAEAN